MTTRTVIGLICCVVLIAAASLSHLATAGIEDPPVCGTFAAGMIDEIPGGIAGWNVGPGLNYSTGFEPAEGIATGYISNSGGTPIGCGGFAFPCWGHTASTSCGTGPGPVCTPSTTTPSIETIHPAAGLQHLRLNHDPTTRTNIASFGLGIDARYPRTADLLQARPVAPSTTSADLAISNPGGMNFRYQNQSNSQGCIQGSALFYEDGQIYILDDFCGAVALNFQPTGHFWDTTGAYRNFTWSNNPCTDTQNYYYDGELIFSGCLILGSNLEQFLVFGDNYPGSYMDVDNVVMMSDESCPCICGNGILDIGCSESCELGVDCNPGHTCGAEGTPEACQCSRTCTLDEPCELTNGANGPFYGPFDAQYGGIFTYQAPEGVDAVSVELCGSTGADQRIFYWGSCTDPADPGTANDDCYPGYSGADPSASCYGTVTGPYYESCTCHDNPLDGDNCYLLQIRPPAGAGQIHIEVNKKAACGQGHLGACCDTNGADTGCTDNVLSADCVGADKVWTENGKCADVVCECIPDCAGATCGDDGCGGSCGTCDDGNVCNGVESCGLNRQCVAGNPLACNDGNACNGLENCDPASGCIPGTPLNCNDGDFCNGMEICVPQSGCEAGTPPCTENETCDEDGEQCVPNTIPTVSDWGLVVLALVLLVAAKVRFSSVRSVS